MTYIYNADIYCDSCGEAIIKELLSRDETVEVDCRSCKWKGPLTTELEATTTNSTGWMLCPQCGLYSVAYDEYKYDSDDFPKDNSHCSSESDSPQHCGACGEFLENDLTTEGIDYVVSMLVDAYQSGKPISNTLKAYYSYYSLDNDISESLLDMFKNWVNP